MPGIHTKNFTSDHAVRSDGSVAFACSQDEALWPWTSIGSHHPGAIQAASYWLSVESAMALGQWDPEKWSALTWSRWRCGSPDVGRMAHGRYERSTLDGRESFSIHLFDAQDRRICRLDGRGVVFRTRDFEGWRKQAKSQAAQLPTGGFDYAERSELGLSPAEYPFLAPLEGDCAWGLLDRSNSMPPAHPWLDGSGDHVNSAHLAEVARQFVSLLRHGGTFEIEAAEMHFDRYVELGSPFRICRLPTEDPATIAMQIRQAGHDCTRVDYRLRA